ncbi:MAG TPA: alpha-xylosidase [Spirochaetia bacterium]|nr:alpha-xylosidase [Spirochaetia bacterium]
MKFTDGYWLVREGYTVLSPAEAYDVREREGTLEVFAPAKRVRDRGDTLNAPGLTFRVSAPAPDVLRVRISHFEGGASAGPDFVLEPQPGSKPGIVLRDTEASITSGRLTARFSRGEGPWNLEFLGDGRVLTASSTKAAGNVKAADGKVYTKEELNLDVGELVYGLGERFSSFVKNGQTVEIWNKDGGTASEQTYKNVPFYLTNRGYGVFVNHPGLVSYEVASEKVSRVGFSVEGEELEYFVFYGPTPKEVLGKYTALLGRAPLPPVWSFGLWLTTSFTTSYDEATCTKFIEGMAERNLPLSVFHFDCFWMREFHWSDFLWDNRTFPDPKGMLTRLKAKGLKICVWINPYIAQRSVMFEEGRRNGYLVKKPDGGVWQTDLWQAGMGIVDFTNPEACAWFAAKLEGLLDLGVDAFKTDFGERIPTDVVWADGSDPERMHNFYPYLYNQTVFELLERKRGEGEAVLFARSATAGCQKFPVHWGGDCDSTFPSMAESLRGGLSLGLSGFGFWSHDIGGFEGTPPEALFHRWVAFGLLSSHSRLHGSSSYRVPWVYGDRAVEVTRFFTKLKLSLMPYLYAQAVETTKTGVPVMRAALLEFPDDLTCQSLDRQYFLGESLLVAPVFRADGQCDVWIPEGTWTPLLGGSAVEGPRWVRQVHDEFSLPLYARPHSLVAFTGEIDRPDSDWKKSLTVKAFALAEGKPAKTRLVDGKGKDLGTVTVTRKGTKFEVAAPEVVLPFTLEAGGKAWKVEKPSQVL